MASSGGCQCGLSCGAGWRVAACRSASIVAAAARVPPTRRRRAPTTAAACTHPLSYPPPASIAITLFNRAVFSVYRFNFPSLVTLLQILISLGYMYALRAAGRMQFSPVSLRGARKVRHRRP